MYNFFLLILSRLISALRCTIPTHFQALRVCPGVASTYASLGLVQSHLGDYQEAIVSLHKALSLQKDHTIAASLLSNLMHQIVANSSGFEGTL